MTEEGWGEFEAAIEIYFHDPEEAPVNLVHMIKLHPPGKRQIIFNKSNFIFLLYTIYIYIYIYIVILI